MFDFNLHSFHGNLVPTKEIITNCFWKRSFVYPLPTPALWEQCIYILFYFFHIYFLAFFINIHIFCRYITEPFKALIQALDHTSKLSHRLHDLPSLSHFLSQHFSLFVSVVHWANTPKTLSLPLPSLCIFLSNVSLFYFFLKNVKIAWKIDVK